MSVFWFKHMTKTVLHFLRNSVGVRDYTKQLGSQLSSLVWFKAVFPDSALAPDWRSSLQVFH